MPEELAYAATKGGLEALTTSLAPWLAARGVTINALDPGPTDTGWMTAAQRKALDGRVSTPEEVARVVRFLVSDEGARVTGQIVRVRGGS
jgi:3-oxoacyl-[acyl-carrier protein] reductase